MFLTIVLDSGGVFLDKKDGKVAVPRRLIVAATTTEKWFLEIDPITQLRNSLLVQSIEHQES